MTTIAAIHQSFPEGDWSSLALKLWGSVYVCTLPKSFGSVKTAHEKGGRVILRSDTGRVMIMPIERGIRV